RPGRVQPRAGFGRVQEARFAGARGPVPAEGVPMNPVARLLALALAACGAVCGQASRPSAAATRPDGPVVLVKGPEELQRKRDLSIEPSADPRMLVVRGRLGKAGDATFEVNGDVWGTAGGFTLGADLFAASMPLPGGWP